MNKICWSRVIVLLLFISCNNVTQTNESTDFEIISNRITDTKTIEAVNMFLIDNTKNERFKNITDQEINFDINTLQSISRRGYSGNMLFLTEVESSAEDNSAFQLGIFSLEDGATKALIVKNELVSNTYLRITYYDLNGSIIQQVEIDNEHQSISFLYKSKSMMPDCGQETLDCVKTMYWELGWGSVSWWVGTAIFKAPWTLGTIIGCGAAMCVL